MFLFSVWDTHFTLGGWVVGYSVDWYPWFLFACQVAFGIVLPFVRIWAILCSLIVWYMPLECLHNGLGLTLSDALLIHMHVGIWFRQFCSMSLQLDEPTLNCFRWYPFLSLHTLSLFYSSLQALSLKNHDYWYLRKFWSFGIALELLLYFLCCLATYPYVPHLVLNPITTLKNPSNLDLHVFLVWLLVLEACQVCWCLFFRGALRVNSSLEIWVIHCIFREVIFLSILSLSWTEYLTCFELLGWCSRIPCNFESFCVGCVSICLCRVCLSCVFLSLLLCLWCPCFALLFNFAQECKRVSVVDFDESLFSSIPLAFVYPFYSCSVLNCSSLVCFHLLGFIEPLFRIWTNFTLFSLFVFNYF